MVELLTYYGCSGGKSSTLSFAIDDRNRVDNSSCMTLAVQKDVNNVLNSWENWYMDDIID